MSSDRSWGWFCGGNLSLRESGKPMAAVCQADLVTFFINAACCVLLCIVLVASACLLRKRSNIKYLRRYPAHTTQWLCMLVLCLFHLCLLAEGFLTDATYQSNDLGEVYPTQPHLYIPSICGLVTTFLAMVYYHHMELWRLPHMVWLLLIYWALVLAGQILNLLALIGTDVASVSVLRFDVCVINMLISSILVVLQGNVIRVKVWCFRSKLYPTHHKDPPNDMKFTEEFTSFVSEYTYWWLDWIFKLGYKRPIEVEDLGRLPEVHSASYLHAQFREAFQKEQSRAKSKNRRLSLWRVYWQVHGWRMVQAFLVKSGADILGFVGPLSLINIIPWVERIRDETESADQPHFVTVSEFFENGVVLVGVTFISLVIRALLLQSFEYWSTVVGVHLRSAIQTMVFEKSLRVSTYVLSSGEMTIGQITNHMSTDAMNIFYMAQYVLQLVTMPLQVGIAVGFLIMQLELSAALGLAVFVFVVPFQIIMGNLMAKYEEKALAFGDERIKMINEVLQGIKLLKMYGWEELFGTIIEKIRRLEIWTITKMMMCYGVLCTVSDAGPALVTFISFATLKTITGKQLIPEVAFSSTSLIYRVKITLFLAPMALFNTANGVISTRRIASFLVALEVEMTSFDSIKLRKHFAVRRKGSNTDVGARATDEYETCLSDGDDEVPLLRKKTAQFKSSNSSLQSTTHEANGSGSYGTLANRANEQTARGLSDDVAIKIVKGFFSWDRGIGEPTLRDISVTFPTGKLIMVVGTVGSGKSSLLFAILEEMFLNSGSLQINRSRDSIAYAGQKAWLINASLKDNILFGRPYHPHRYNQVIAACALQADIDILPAGDQTEIGEKGINVSGGQKQRISVARAMYSGRDIVLLDDPLSALDVHVGEHLFKNGIIGILRKKKKTVILVTHQLQYLANADKILVMKDGRIAEAGTFDDISAVDPDLYSSYQKAVRTMTEESDTTTDAEKRRQELTFIKRQVTRRSRLTGAANEKEHANDEKGRLLVKEELVRGSVSWEVYYLYAKAIGLLVLVVVITLYPVQAGVNIGVQVWLSEWTNAEATQGNATDTAYYIQIYAAITAAAILSPAVVYCSTVVALLVAAKRLFNIMLQNVIHMQMRFFDTTPIGRIINRFSADIQIIDMKLLLSYNALIWEASILIGGIILNSIISPIFIAAIAPLFIVYYLIRKVFIMTSRELQRLDSVFKSPIFARFSETLGGLSTIRAFRRHQSFFDGVIERVSTNNTVFLYLQISIIWLTLRLEFLGTLLVLTAGLTSVLGAVYGDITASEVGLGISYTLTMANYVQLLVRNMALAEMQMNAVERIKYYTTLETECYEGKEPPVDWPTSGAILIENISVRYAEELEPVLKDVSVQIEAGKKVGICGRTGSGKSSLTLALYRIIDTFKGRIMIDGIDIATVPLTTLRQRLAIIPQDPVLFHGTVRMNLDPENRQFDHELWHALEIAQLKDFVMQMGGQLDAIVAEGGETFSVGQRQLFCLARAFLRNAHILIMDEATASIDMETDKILQRVVDKVFTGKTILTIAHRVATILNSDTILTLSKGEVIEHDTPDNLLMDPDSVFASLVYNDQ